MDLMTVADPSINGSIVEIWPFVDGRRGAGARVADIINPAASATVVGRVHEATVDLANGAVAAAARAMGAWSATPVDARIALLRTAVEAAAETIRREDLPALLTREQGKILPESGAELGMLPFIIEQNAALAQQALADVRLDDARGTRIQTHTAIGPVAIVTPWNWPVLLSMLKVIPALLTGNTVVLKPAPNTPLTIARIIETMAQVLPPGVLNIVFGGADIGAALTSHPLVRKVMFTGSTASGRKVFAACAPGIRKMSLELGGNDPAILLDDVELSPAMMQLMAQSIFVTAGQVCWAIKRLYAPRRRHDEIVAAFVSLANGIVVGDGLTGGVTMGPLNNQAQLDTVRSLVADATAHGATIATCGRYAAGIDPDNGFFHLPTIVSGVDDHLRLVREEQFGPVLPILMYDDLDDCIARAKDTEYGLCASVWTSNSERGFEVARRLDSGQAYVNCHSGAAMDASVPFGGVKQSGFGRELGLDGLLEFTERRLYSNRLTR